ncbi:MAG: carbohydrate porin [Verrucomicrobiota bacterium]
MNRTTNRLVRSLLLLTVALSPLAKAGDADPKDNAPSQALTFPTSYTSEGFANLAGGYKRGAVYDGLLSVGVQGNLEKLIGWRGGSLLVSGLYPHGTSLTNNYVHDLNHVSSIDAYDSIRLYEAWVQQEFAEGKVSLRLGQILADEEFFVSDSAGLFLNGAFGDLPVITMSINAPVYPTAAPGARVRWTATDALSVQAGLFSGDAGDPATENKHGLDWHLNEGVLAITEVAYKINSEKGSKGLAGVYKLGAFFHSSEPNSAFPNAQTRANAGGYFIADQQLWRKPGTEDQGLSGFFRMGASPADRSSVPFYFDTGFNCKGLLPERDKDIAGVGFSYTHLSSEMRDDAGDPSITHHEAALEATYKVAVKEWLTVQPDFQYIFNPGGIQGAPNAVVAGLRCTLNF